MSFNHFPYVQIVTNLEYNPCTIQTVIRIATKF